MKLIVVGRKHAFAVELQFPLSVARVQVTDSGDAHDESCDEEIPMPDPHSVPHAHIENAAQRADFVDLSLEPMQVQAGRKFGFHGSGQ